MPVTQAVRALAHRAATASFALSATAPGTAAAVGLVALLLVRY